jgi:hypothetical protein
VSIGFEEITACNLIIDRCMKTTLVILFTLVAILVGIVVIFVGAVWLFEYLETSESHFETYQQLEESELMGKGWVPSFIPRSAYDIKERHKVDVGRVNVKFRFRPGDTKEIQKSCTKVKTDDTNTQYYRCKHGNDMVVVRLGPGGTGEILSE